MYQYDTFLEVSYSRHSLSLPISNINVKGNFLMSLPSRNILLIDDDPCHAKAFEEALKAAGDGSSNFEWFRTLSERP